MDSRKAPCPVYIIPVRLDGCGGPKIQRAAQFATGCRLFGEFFTYGKERPASKEAGYKNLPRIARML